MNPWTESHTNLRHQRCRTESVEGVFSLSPPIEKNHFLLSRCHGGGEYTDKEELMRVTTTFFVVTPLSRVVTPAINTLSSGYAQSVTT